MEDGDHVRNDVIDATDGKSWFCGNRESIVPAFHAVMPRNHGYNGIMFVLGLLLCKENITPDRPNL